jgi:hypothetical protein
MITTRPTDYHQNFCRWATNPWPAIRSWEPALTFCDSYAMRLGRRPPSPPDPARSGWCWNACLPCSPSISGSNQGPASNSIPVPLAFLPEQERARLCRQQKLVRSTSRTIITQAALEAELISVRLQGWAVDLAEAIEGCHCVGAPVFDQRHYPVGAIWVTGPANPLESKRFLEVGERVRACARSISRRLSGEAMDIPASIRKG